MPESPTILLVDDEDSIQKLLTYPLERDGYRVVQARDGEEALRRFEEDHVDLVVLDFWIYWWHRANHEIPILWRFHQVHHFDELLDSTTAVRFHFGEVVLSALVRAVVIIVLDIPLNSVLVFEALVLMSAIFHHSDARLSPRLEQTLARLVQSALEGDMKPVRDAQVAGLPGRVRNAES